MRKTGIVKWYNDSKGYGFITDTDNIDVFVHYSRILGDGFRSLKEGEKVSFDFDEQPKGPHALNIIKEADIQSQHPKEEKTEPSPKRSLRVFLCHSKNDKPIVRELYTKLSSNGLDPWLDEEKLLPGQDWNLEIINAVTKTDVVLVCLSTSSVSKTGYVQKEIKYALDVAQQQPEGSIFIIPAKFEECEIPQSLSRWQWVNMYEAGGYQKLVKALEHKAKDLSLSVPKVI